MSHASYQTAPPCYNKNHMLEQIQNIFTKVKHLDAFLYYCLCGGIINGNRIFLFRWI